MKGFGFIAGDDGKEYFVHTTGLESGVHLRENDAVSFDVQQGDRGPKAVHVKMAGAESESAPASDESSVRSGKWISKVTVIELDDGAPGEYVLRIRAGNQVRHRFVDIWG